VSKSQRFPILLRAAKQLGLTSLGLYALYQAGLRSGYFRRVTSSETKSASQGPFTWTMQSDIIAFPSKASLDSVNGFNLSALLSLADEITQGEVRLFDGEPKQLELVPPGPMVHWTDYETGRVKSAITDIKMVWEPLVSAGRNSGSSLPGFRRRAVCPGLLAFNRVFPGLQPPVLGSELELSARSCLEVDQFGVFNPDTIRIPPFHSNPAGTPE
jgi:hypothetical protein